MKFNNENTLTQLDQKIEQLQHIRNYIEKADAKKAMEIYALSHQKKWGIQSFLEDNRDLINQTVEYLNTISKDFGYHYETDSRSMNTTKLTLHCATQSTRAEVDLRLKDIKFYSRPFRDYSMHANDFIYYTKEIAILNNKLERFQKDYERFEKMNPFILQFKKIKKEDFPLMKEHLVTIETQRDEYKENLVEMAKKENELIQQATEKFKNLSLFIDKMEKLGFTHNYYEIEDTKTYNLYAIKADNYSFSSVCSFQQSQVIALHEKEWPEEDIIKQPVLQKLTYTDSQYEQILQELLRFVGELSVKDYQTENSRQIHATFSTGEVIVHQTGILEIKGKDLSIMHLTFYPSIIQSLFPKQEN